jgi:hypothetical protein
VCVLASFVVGFGVSFVSRKTTPVAEAKIQIADFRVPIPEGETIVTIISRQPEGQPLGKLTIQRRGNTIFGVPSGGAFRVIDVIVTEAPRFNQ